MLVKFEQNRMAETTPNFELFDKKTGVSYNHFLKMSRGHLRRRFGTCNYYLMLNY